MSATAPITPTSHSHCRSDMGDRNLEVRISSREKGIPGQFAEQGDRVEVLVTGRTLDGKVFWRRQSEKDSAPLWFTVGSGEVPQGLDEGIARVGLGQRASLLCSPAYAAHPAGVIVPAGVPVVYEVELKEIVSWTQYGREVWRIRASGPNSCISTLMRCSPHGTACSLQALFPDEGEQRGHEGMGESIASAE